MKFENKIFYTRLLLLRWIDGSTLSGLFQKYTNEFLLTAKAQRSQRKWFFVLTVRGRQNKSLHLFKAKCFVQMSAGGREAAFYSAASHGRIKENINPLRSRRLCGEYVTEFMNCHT